MCKKKQIFFLFLFAALVTHIQVWPKFGINKTWITFMMHHPPAFVTPGREVRTDTNTLDSANALWASQFKILLEQSLVGANYKPTPNAQTVIQFTINEISSSVRQESRLQSVSVHTGYHNVYDNKGNATRVEDCGFQQAQVTYLISSGNLGATLQVTDTKSQSVLANRVFNPRYQRESDIAGPPKCGGLGYGVSPGQIQDTQTIRRWLVEQAATETMRMVAGYDEPRRAMLTVDNELKPGNTYALAGNWSQAFDSWKSATIKEKDRGKEAARQYNLGLAHEALAATVMRDEKLDEANSHLNEAEKCYSQALNLDPGEKYFREILARLQRDRAVLKQEQEHQFMKEVAAAQLAAPQNAAPPVPTASIPLEGWPAGESDVVHDYRLYIRSKVAAQKDEPNETLKQKLISSASDYGVKEGIALQVVNSEVGRFLVLKQNEQKYQDDFKDAASDGVITAEERVMLKRRQQILHLTDAQVKDIESPFRCKEGH